MEISVEILSTSVPISKGTVRYKVKTWWAHVDIEETKKKVKLPPLPMIEHYYKLNGKETTVFVELWYINEDLYPAGAMRFLGLSKCPIDPQLKIPSLNPSVEWLEVYDPIEDIVRGRMLLKVDAKFTDESIPYAKSDVGGSPRSSSYFYPPCPHLTHHQKFNNAQLASPSKTSISSPNPSLNSNSQGARKSVTTSCQTNCHCDPLVLDALPESPIARTSPQSIFVQSPETPENLNPPKVRFRSYDSFERRSRLSSNPPSPPSEMDTRESGQLRVGNRGDFCTERGGGDYLNQQTKFINPNYKRQCPPHCIPQRLDEDSNKKSNEKYGDAEDEDVEDVIHLLNDNFDLVKARAENQNWQGMEDLNKKSLEPKKNQESTEELLRRNRVSVRLNDGPSRRPPRPENQTAADTATKSSGGHGSKDVDMTLYGFRMGFEIKSKASQKNNHENHRSSEPSDNQNPASKVSLSRRPPRSRKIAAAIFNNYDDE